MFPVEISRADYETLLRIPGVGLKSAERLIAARRFGNLHFNDLSRLGVVLKRARYFITCQGNYLEKVDNDSLIRQKLLLDEPHLSSKILASRNQLPLFGEL
jgi:predicted DNA-binding helix-hairpin-helix protein